MGTQAGMTIEGTKDPGNAGYPSKWCNIQVRAVAYLGFHKGANFFWPLEITQMKAKLCFPILPELNLSAEGSMAQCPLKTQLTALSINTITQNIIYKISLCTVRGGGLVTLRYCTITKRMKKKQGRVAVAIPG